MKKNLEYFEGLIAAYFSGELDPAGISELSGWVGADPANEAIFRASGQAWTAVESVRIAESLNVDSEWNKFTKQTGIKAGDRSLDPALFIEKTPFIVQKTPREKAVRPVVPMYSLFLRIAAVVILLAVPSFFLFRYLTNGKPTEISSASGRIETLLPDGSRITLNRGALLSYSGGLKGKLRSVSLKGEAYFDVAHNISRPFIISSGEIRVEVKGTSFYINTRSEGGDFELVLTTGRVELYFNDRPGEHGVISPGEKAIVHGREIRIVPNTDMNYMAWKTHHIVFNNDQLDEVALILSKVYQTGIRLNDPSLAHCRITATFDNQTLGSVLNVLKATLDLDIRNSGSLVEISGQGCR
jgi:transmembrane sensor